MLGLGEIGFVIFIGVAVLCARRLPEILTHSARTWRAFKDGLEGRDAPPRDVTPPRSEEE